MSGSGSSSTICCCECRDIVGRADVSYTSFSGTLASLSSSESDAIRRVGNRCLLCRTFTTESSSSSLISTVGLISSSFDDSSSSPHQMLVSFSSSGSTSSVSLTMSSFANFEAGSRRSTLPMTLIVDVLVCFLTTLLARVFAYINRVLFPTSISVVPLRTLRSRCFFSGLAKLSPLIFLSSRLLLSTGLSMRCFRGVSASEITAGFGPRHEASVSCDELVDRMSRFERFGTRTEFSSSSSDDIMYCADRVVFLGLDRVALVVLGGIKIVGSFGLGLRRRAMVAGSDCATGRDTRL
jgi:hypothetical protein